MADIFVSYTRRDRTLVQPIVALLESKGWTVWWDTRIGAGETWDEVIERELAVARCVVVVWSIESIGSRWVRAEASEGLERGILIPVHIDIARPPLEFKLIQSLDFSNWRSDGHDSSANELIGAVSKLLGAPFGPPASPPPIPNGPDDSFILPQALGPKVQYPTDWESTRRRRYPNILIGIGVGVLVGIPSLLWLAGWFGGPAARSVRVKPPEALKTIKAHVPPPPSAAAPLAARAMTAEPNAGQIESQRLAIHKAEEDNKLPKILQPPPATHLPDILAGPSNVVPECITPGRLMAFMKMRNPQLKPHHDGIASEYMRLGELLGIRWDFAFYQMIVETSALTYSRGGRATDVRPEQYNFAGLGATGGGERGESFKDIETGVRAHLEQVLLYAGRPVANPVAERTRKVQAWGVLAAWQEAINRPITYADLAAKWAPGSKSYGDMLRTLAERFHSELCNVPDPRPELLQEARRAIARATAK